MQGFIRRVKTLTGVRFDFFIELPGHVLFCMAAAKLVRSLTGYYCVALVSESISRDSPHYLGKLRASSVGGTSWVLYDNGLSAKDTAGDALLLRRQLLAIEFERNILGAAGPSKLQVVLPSHGGSSGAQSTTRRGDEDKSLTERHGAPGGQRWQRCARA